MATAADTRKTFGAFYTDQRVASFLSWWAVREPSARVLDPCFGGGVFLREALATLSRLGGTRESLVCGVEVDSRVFGSIREALDAERVKVPLRLVAGDFFDLAPSMEGQFTAVVGNPPFIRYQRFGSDSRRKALELAQRNGVKLSQLCSSWAPFLVASASCLGVSGRLAMVVPAEIGHAGYARPVMAYFLASFRTVTLVTFRRRLFPDLSQDTMLLLAEDKSPAVGARGHLRWLDLDDAGALVGLVKRGDLSALASASRVDTKGMVEQGQHFALQYLPPKVRRLYLELARGGETLRLGELADVGIGYVTGANRFFHLDRKTLKRFDLPESATLKAVTRGSHLRGLILVESDWLAAWERGEAVRLLHLPDTESGHAAEIARYLEYGERQRVPNSYKCRIRSPWFRVPHVRVPDAVLTYMSGGVPRLVVNSIGAVVPNTLHAVRIRAPRADVESLAVSFLTSLTRLSTELEGHGMGGGLLKLEPREAEAVLVVPGESNGLAIEADKLIRSGRLREANELADQAFLMKGLGLSRRDCALLLEGAGVVRDRRRKRGVQGEPRVRGLQDGAHTSRHGRPSG